MKEQKHGKKSLLIKLGGACNLTCRHCHCMKIEFKFNEDIFPFIRENDFGDITFSGGEPFLYFDTIKHICLELGSEYKYKAVTNGTVFTEEMADFINCYDFLVPVSFDGSQGTRDTCTPMKLTALQKLHRKGIAVTVYDSNINFERLGFEVAKFKLSKLGLKGFAGNFFPNFVHQTKQEQIESVSKSTVKQYILQLGKMLEEDIVRYTNGIKIVNLSVLNGIMKKWFQFQGCRGVRCCNKNMINLTLDGKLLLCPYGYKVVGDIYSGLSYEMVERCLPAKCKACELFSICMNQCVENLTENECYIFKMLYRHFNKLLDKYRLDLSMMIEERCRQ